MILYCSDVADFKCSVDTNVIVDKIEASFMKAFMSRPDDGERRAWNNSMRFMERVVRNARVADDCGILIEFMIPMSSKRIDFIISGQNDLAEKNFVIVELKQWDRAYITDHEDVVAVYVGGRQRNMVHPSYQAWSYKQMLDDMNMAIQTNSIGSYACSYLHNYAEKNPEPLKSLQYKKIIDKAPIYFKEDVQKLQMFLSTHVGKGKGMDILDQLEHGKIKPSKKLIDHVASVFQGNSEYILIDEQKVAYETILRRSKEAGVKQTIIVKGGPGTGKSVVSLNVFGQLVQYCRNIRFVAPNAAFREVILEKLCLNTGDDKERLRNLFSGSNQYYNIEANVFDVMVVDEAHRLKGAGTYKYRGKSQVEDIIKASMVNVFFIDDAQRIRPDDIGTVEEIKRVANRFHSKVCEIELQAQFRCAGAEGFVNWLDTVLQIRETGNFNGWDKKVFDFRIIDNPNDLRQLIKTKNSEKITARMLAGYAWKWTDEKSGNFNGEIADVVISEHNFSMPWNSRANRELWAIRPEGENQIGCIHTSQGLEFDYVGVIIGGDLRFNPLKKCLYVSYDEYRDEPGKKGLKFKQKELTSFVCNVYKTLMSRGMKGCYVYCVDKNLQQYFKERLAFTVE